MTTPTIPELPQATVANNGDQMLMRQPAGSLGTDKRITVEEVRKIDIDSLSTASSPSSSLSGDLFMFQRSGTNYKIRFDQISVPSGTIMWFYRNTTIDGWTIESSAPDTVLAVKGGSEYVNGGVTGGTWQQEGVNGGSPGGGLSISQMPRHDHTFRFADSGGTGAILNRPPREVNPPSPSGIVGVTSIVGGQHSTNPNEAEPHNHGDSWRPSASVGVLLKKS